MATKDSSGIESTSDRQGKPAATWRNIHDNGWSSNVIENPDGTFSAWAASPNAPWAVADYVEAGLESAQRAAEYALARKSGHQECSPSCSGWHIHRQRSQPK